MFEVCFQRRMLRYNRSMFRIVRAQQMIECRYDTVHRIPENCDVVHVVLEEWPDLGFCVNSIGEMPSHGAGIGPAWYATQALPWQPTNLGTIRTDPVHYTVSSGSSETSSRPSLVCERTAVCFARVSIAHRRSDLARSSSNLLRSIRSRIGLRHPDLSLLGNGAVRRVQQSSARKFPYRT